MAEGTYKPIYDRNGNTTGDNQQKTFPLKPNLELYGGFAGGVGVAPEVDGDVGALTGEGEGDSAADAPRGAGHEGGLSLEFHGPLHAMSPGGGEGVPTSAQGPGAFGRWIIRWKR